MEPNSVNSVQKVRPGINKCCVIFTCCKKSRGIPEDAVDERRDASELKLISLKKTCINC